MEWWLKAAFSIGGVMGGVYATHTYNEHYRKNGIEHPITAFIRQQMSSEAVDRELRIAELQKQSELAESRLSRLHKWIPGRQQESGGVMSNRKAVIQEGWKSDF